ncbi:hypothetical protein AOQ84DRAFT_15099 [Glonium stellatum]|uniref:Rhodopsin domain-containing protein n=1 Tax=Glonium stellatum TaxID=574774 RepID=A0A8E2FCV5_9PEZI|nr:hypothetical protein AOQ84DRAFT_15099 [Glonium stellatum]
MLMSTQSPTAVIATAVVLSLLDIIVVGLRFYARRRQRQRVQADDWLTIPALALVLGLAAVLITGVAQHALAYPTPVVQARSSLSETNDKIIISARLQYVFIVMSVPTLGFIKLSFLCFYRRIFIVDKSDIKDVFNVAVTTMICVISLWTGGFFFAFTFACKGHFTAWWTSAISLIENCVNTLNLLYSMAISDFICDVLIVLLPIPRIWKLHLPTSRKLAVCAVFLLGLVAVLASTIRMVWCIWAHNVGFDTSLDEDLLITALLFWCMVEVALGLLAACLPTLKSLVQIQSVDSMIHSVRSKLSLRSSRSSQSGDSSNHDILPEWVEPKHDHNSRDSGIHVISPATYAVDSISQGGRMHGLPRGKILVEKKFGSGSSEHTEA